MKKKLILVFIILLISNIYFIYSFSSNEIANLEKVKVNITAGDIYIAYKSISAAFLFPILKKDFIIDYYYFFTLDKENRIIILGKVTKTGIFNANGEPIVEVKPKQNTVIGVSPRVIEYPTSPNFIMQKKDKFLEEDTFASIGIDMNKKTIFRIVPLL